MGRCIWTLVVGMLLGWGLGGTPAAASVAPPVAPSAPVYRLFLPLQATANGVTAAPPPAAPPTPSRPYRYFFPLQLSTASGKQGVGGDCATAGQLGASWYYTWSPQPARCAPADFPDVLPRGVPMLWGDWGDGPVPAVGPGPYLLGFNEPDLPQQANITPARAALLWRQIEAAYPGRLLIAPAPSHVHPEWLVAWWTAYQQRYGAPPRVHALAAHCYFATAAACQAHVRWFIAQAQAWGVPGGVWVTEFAVLPCPHELHGVGGQPGLPAALAEAERLVAWFAATPEVATYFWFVAHAPADAWWAFQPMPDCDTSLRTADGTLTAWGEWYRTAGGR